MSDDHLFLTYDDEKTDDEPMIVATYSAHWLPFLLATAANLKKPSLWDSAGDVDEAVFQAKDLLVRLMGVKGAVVGALSGPIKILAEDMYLRGAADTLVNDSAYVLSRGIYQSTPVSEQLFAVAIVSLAAGDYIARTVYNTWNAAGMLRIRFDGPEQVLLDKLDCYTPSVVLNNIYSDEFTIAKSGQFVLSLRASGKHASSSNYYLNLQSVQIALKTDED